MPGGQASREAEPLRQILIVIPSLQTRTLRLREMKSPAQAEKWQSPSGDPVTALPGTSWHVEGLRGRLPNCLEGQCEVLGGPGL